ncbi:MAG: hypothetical protein JWR07_5103 [Nevskia sp.]|nr:hypothetical protein [Nevskia sp.]
MCYSAQVWTSYRSYVREWGVDISIKEYLKLYRFREAAASKVYIPKGMDAAFVEPTTAEEREIKSLIDQYNFDQAKILEAELFKQTKRKADAERTLQTKTTKKAREDKRIAGDKIEGAKDKLADLHRTETKAGDGRIFPFWWAPVMVMEGGKLVVKPMRYHCRLDGWHAAMEKDYGTYNARRDSFGGTWKKQFGYQHGIMVVNRFYENVARHDMEGRPLRPGEKKENVRLEFNPNPAHDMLVACLWHRSRGFGEELDEFYSFAAITDEPPAEVAAAGHDRCIVPIKPQNVEAWLNPDPNNLAAMQAILDDRDRPYYEHRLAA